MEGGGRVKGKGRIMYKLIELAIIKAQKDIQYLADKIGEMGKLSGEGITTLTEAMKLIQIDIEKLKKDKKVEYDNCLCPDGKHHEFMKSTILRHKCDCGYVQDVDITSR